MNNRFHQRNLRAKAELSAIFVVAALLILSIANLIPNIVTARAHSDIFPKLYAPESTAQTVLEERTIYLTFDDGPSINTERILDILAKRGATATFFVTAQEYDREYLARLINRIIDEGHSLGLHSLTHNFSEIYASPEAYLRDIDELRGLIEEISGYRPSIVRFPGGSHTINATRETIAAIQSELARRGYIWYDWDICTGDSGAHPRPAEAIARSIIDNVLEQGGGIIVLCHDNRNPVTTPDAIGIAIDTLMPQGFKFTGL